MVEFRQIKSVEWRKLRPLALQLIQGHRDGHITQQAHSHVRALRSDSLNQDGNVVWSAWVGRRLVGLIVFEKFGNRTSMVVVHRDYRGQGIARELAARSMKLMGRFYAEIAVDNIPSLRSVFAGGMVAYGVFMRRGKAILRVRNGFDPSA